MWRKPLSNNASNQYNNLLTNLCFSPKLPVNQQFQNLKYTFSNNPWPWRSSAVPRCGGITEMQICINRSKRQSKTMQKANVRSETKSPSSPIIMASMSSIPSAPTRLTEPFPWRTKSRRPTNPNSRNGLLFPTRATELLVVETVEAAAEPDFEAEPVADADYQRKKKKTVESVIEDNNETRNQRTVEIATRSISDGWYVLTIWRCWDAGGGVEWSGSGIDHVSAKTGALLVIVQVKKALCPLSVH